MQYGIVIQPVATIYEIPAETMVKDGMTLSAIADEAMYGTALAITGAEVTGAEITGAEITGREAVISAEICTCSMGRFTSSSLNLSMVF